MYKIKLPINYDGYRYGISFFKGVGETDSKSLANRLEAKGFEITVVSDEESAADGNGENADEKEGEESAADGVREIDYNTLSDEELAAAASEKGISLDGKTKKTRQQVINLLKKEG
ncbi:hypothetical protein QE152_g39998 [Popillia japonica]|uniref:Rho termination factor N-terminal domain-containing protein n=1 Tax=Popillia japonica TaxID=7064 RepID=A0AAW1HSP4_POPJA